MPYWDERFAAIGSEYPEVRRDQFHIDILTAHFVAHPDWFDVVVGSNLFGDILSDLGPAVAGSIGIAPSANINPERAHPSMFEPVHGSAPDIAGQHICNPIGQIWSAAMMLEHLGENATPPTPSSPPLRASSAMPVPGPATWAGRPAPRRSGRRWRTWSGRAESLSGNARRGAYQAGAGGERGSSRSFQTGAEPALTGRPRLG